MKLARMPDGSPEIFHTVQGEGRHAGRPSVFIRSSHCNLSCRWCDTPYTWNWQGTSHDHDEAVKYDQEEQIIEMSVKEIADHVGQYPCHHFVFTGGEPLLHEKEWIALMELLSGTYEVETNGTILPGDSFLERVGQINVSPKLSNSGVDSAKRIRPSVLEGFAAIEQADFKFVVATQDDFAEVESLIDQFDLPRNRVFLMPQASTPDELDHAGSFVPELAEANGLQFSDRLHLRLFGATRGT
ncbi:MAG: 7-carboxy-7-deazaguanine synthase QueE [Verrucomicrobiota bacterium]